SSAIVTLDRRRGRLSLVAQHGLHSEVLQRIVEREVALEEQAIIGFMLRHHQPVISDDIAQDERFPASHLFASELAIRSIFSYPLAIGSTSYGALLLCSPEPGGFTPLKIDILSLFASQATIAIHNGMLLEAARERRRFQEAIEQLEHALQEHRSASTNQLDDLVLLKQVQEEAERTFGVSFSGLLHFISDHLLTSSERDLQDILHAGSNQQRDQEADYLAGNAPLLPEERTEVLVQTAEAALARAGLLGDVSAALTASIDPDQVLSSDASALAQLYERVTRDMTSPWFVTDQEGRCIYANPAAEVFCGMRLGLSDLNNLGDLHQLMSHIRAVRRDAPPPAMSWPLESQAHFVPFSRTVIHQPASLTLREALAGLLPRMRNAEEVLSYLTEFTGSDLSESSKELVEGKQHMDALPANTLRCVIAAEPVLSHAPEGFRGDGATAATRELFSFKTPRDKTPGNRFSPHRAMQLHSAPSDRHYQFMRYALYNPRGQLLANALQIQDITEQVRDEKNKSVLLSTISHDLRTPLTTIKAAVTGLLQADLDWDEQLRREILEDIDAGADHLYKLVDSLIEMSRIDMGALVLEKEWCDLVEIVHNALARAERLVAGHTVRTQFQPHLPQVQVDYVQLGRVLVHLLENAVRHSPENAEIVIAVDDLARGRPEDDHRFLRVQIIDHGSGVPEEERERIFKTFYSLDSQGIGLGLAICRGIIEAHQGRIWVEPAPDGGACFVFTLPIFS
ncbi:MAG TPA: ATP-binding protein, partial [Ktedonobacteraceae bacterium]|nr:ATP-binding protein [Ktedonobacteraceae bacterium]